MRYQLSSVGKATLHLGLTINYDRQKNTLVLGNKSYIQQVAARVGIPLDVTLATVTPFAKPRTRQAYRAGVGSVSWLAITNRPNPDFAISQLARFLATPTTSHTTALVHVLKYTVLTRHHSLCYR